MKLFSSEQMRELDRKAIDEGKIPGVVLMEHAGLEVAREVKAILGNVRKKTVLVMCGPGNNGGDGLVSARILKDWGARVFALRTFSDTTKLAEMLQQSDLIVDGIFGVGLKRPIEAETARAIEMANTSGKPIVAIDLPSGIDADTGKILGTAVKAHTTLTLGAPKVGLFLYPGRSCAGTLKIAYISIPQQFLEEAPCAAQVADAGSVAGWLPKWKPDIHKGERGRVMIVGGSRGYSGAPALAAMAALHSGSGLVYLGIPDGIRTLMEHKLTEVIKIGIPQTNAWVLGKPSLPETRAWFEKIDAMGIGPGIGRSDETLEYVRTVISEYKGPLVVDADALFALDENFLKTHGRPTMILTPHEGEMAHLCGILPEQVRDNRLTLAIEKAKTWNVTLVLKGASTLIVSGNSIWINPTGNPGMATAGSGDVLTGVILSLLGQKMDPEKASAAGAFLHGLSGDILEKEIGQRGITAERLSTYLFKAFQTLSFG